MSFFTLSVLYYLNGSCNKARTCSKDQMFISLNTSNQNVTRLCYDEKEQCAKLTENLSCILITYLPVSNSNGFRKMVCIPSTHYVRRMGLATNGVGHKEIPIYSQITAPVVYQSSINYV